MKFVNVEIPIPYIKNARNNEKAVDIKEQVI